MGLNFVVTRCQRTIKPYLEASEERLRYFLRGGVAERFELRLEAALKLLSSFLLPRDGNCRHFRKVFRTAVQLELRTRLGGGGGIKEQGEGKRDKDTRI